MGNYDEASAQQRRQRQFLDDLEHAIHGINHDTIHAILPRLDKENFMQMAHAVAKSRVKYLAAATAGLGDGEPLTAQQLLHLRQLREYYEESLKAFEALKRAITRNYIDIANGKKQS